MSARLKSSIFVSAIIRNVNANGGFAAVLRHGSDEAGAIFISVMGSVAEGNALYAQVPQAILAEREDAAAGGRYFEMVGSGLSPDELDARFQKEARMDPDFWVLEVELFGAKIEDFISIA